MLESTKTFSRVCEQFLEIHEAAYVWKSPSTAQMYRASFALFQELVGDRMVNAYTNEDALQFHTCLREIPTGWKRNKELRGLTFIEVRNLEPKLSEYVIRTRLLAVNSLFEYAKTKQLIPTNIFEVITIRRQAANR